MSQYILLKQQWQKDGKVEIVYFDAVNDRVYRGFYEVEDVEDGDDFKEYFLKENEK